MKASRFTELLNLYIDQELSAPEASELEAEIARNPQRRRTYEQYCRMQRACTMLFESARAQAPAHAKLAVAERAAEAKVQMFPSRGVRTPLWQSTKVWGGGLGAAAACILAVFALRETPTESMPVPLSSASALVQTGTSAPVALPAARPDSSVTAESREPADFHLAAIFTPAESQSVHWVGRGEASGLSLEWVNQVVLPTLPHVSETLRFGPDRGVGDQPTTLRSGPAGLLLDEEFNAYEFRR